MLFRSVNDYGFIETPYRQILNAVPNDGSSAIDCLVASNITAPNCKTILVKAGELINKTSAAVLARYKKDIETISIKPKVGKVVEYLDAHREETLNIAQANLPHNIDGTITKDKVIARRNGEPLTTSISKVDYMDVSPRQIVSIATSLIPFVEHDDAKRALMGSNMQRQAVPLIKPQVPVVGTGMERAAAVGSGWVIVAPDDGTVKYVDARVVELITDKDKKTLQIGRAHV